MSGGANPWHGQCLLPPWGVKAAPFLLLDGFSFLFGVFLNHKQLLCRTKLVERSSIDKSISSSYTVAVTMILRKDQLSLWCSGSLMHPSTRGSWKMLLMALLLRRRRRWETEGWIPLLWWNSVCGLWCQSEWLVPDYSNCETPFPPKCMHLMLKIPCIHFTVFVNIYKNWKRNWFLPHFFHRCHSLTTMFLILKTK